MFKHKKNKATINGLFTVAYSLIICTPKRKGNELFGRGFRLS